MVNQLNTKRLQELSLVAIVIMLVQVALSRYVYPIFDTGTQQLFSITPATAITSPTIGNKVIATLSGIVPINLGALNNWLAIFIGVLALLIAGYWVYNQRTILGLKVWQGRNMTQRLFAILAYGSIVLYAALLLLKVDSIASLGIPLAIGIAVNYFVVALVVSSLAKMPTFRFLRI